MPKPVDDPWSANPTPPTPPAPEPPRLPQPPSVPGPASAPIPEVSLPEAWQALIQARRDYLAALHHRAVVRALLSTAYRAVTTRATNDVVQTYCLTHPDYLAAVELVHVADANNHRALAMLELARIAAGLTVSDNALRLPTEW